MAGEALFTLQNLKDRVGSVFAGRVLDDDESGEPTDTVVRAIIDDARGFVWAALPLDYELPATNDTTRRRTERINLKRIALDYAQAQMWIRTPEQGRMVEGIELMKAVVKSMDAYGATLTKASEAGAAEGGGAVVSGPTTTGTGSQAVTSGQSAFSSGSSNPWLR